MNEWLLTVRVGGQNQYKVFKWEFTGVAYQAHSLMGELMTSAENWITMHHNNTWQIEDATIALRDGVDYERAGQPQS